MRILLESFAGKFVSDINRRDVESFQAVRRQPSRKDGLPRANSTCNREVEALRRLLNKAIEWGMLERIPPPGSNACRSLRTNPVPLPRRGQTSTGSIFEALAAHHRLRLKTGMRRGEILNQRGPTWT